jgi:hypothetical protein
MDPMSWTCPGCGQTFAADVRVCPLCKVTQILRRAPPGAEERAVFSTDDLEVELPLSIPGARFSVPTEGGPVWTSGSLAACEEGLFLLSEKDGLAPEEAVRRPPGGPGRVAPLSLFLPRGFVRRVVHHRLTGYFVEGPDTKIPLRLDAAGWKALDAACRRLGIPCVA